MRVLHAWDCPTPGCNTRNAPAFTHCRRCQAPAREGYAVTVEAAPLPASAAPALTFRGEPCPEEWRFPWGMLWIGLPILGFLFLRFAPGDLLFPVLAGLSFVPWAAIPFFIFLWLLGRIVRAVERRD